MSDGPMGLNTLNRLRQRFGGEIVEPPNERSYADGQRPPNNPKETPDYPSWPEIVARHS